MRRSDVARRAYQQTRPGGQLAGGYSVNDVVGRVGGVARLSVGRGSVGRVSVERGSSRRVSVGAAGVGAGASAVSVQALRVTTVAQHRTARTLAAERNLAGRGMGILSVVGRSVRASAGMRLRG